VKREIVVQNLFRLASDESGAELVEFALTALILMLLLTGGIQLIFAMYAYHFTSYAAQQGARFAIVRGYTWSKSTATNCSTSAPPNFTMQYDCTASATDIQNYVKSLATPGITASNVTINTSTSHVWPGTTPDGTTSACSTHANSQGCLVEVSVSYTVDFVPFMPMTAIPMSAVAEKAIVQ